MLSSTAEGISPQFLTASSWITSVSGTEKIIAEARYARKKQDTFADTAFIVDEDYHSKGIASYLFELLIRTAREEGIQGFTADVLSTNKAMLKVYEKSPFPVQPVLSRGVYDLTIPFTPLSELKEKD